MQVNSDGSACKTMAHEESPNVIVCEIPHENKEGKGFGMEEYLMTNKVSQIQRQLEGNQKTE